MIDVPKLSLVAVEQCEFERVFSHYKHALYHYIDAVFGWDEHFQRKRLQESALQGFYWVENGDNPVGLVWFNVNKSEQHNALHLHLLLVFSKWQNQGFGQEIINLLTSSADQQDLKYLTLSSFIANQRAIRFYQRQGFAVVEQETHFVSMRRLLYKSLDKEKA
ncbi:Acetyltransferase (GNAT) domain-containing protein [Vibrio xiamenensis]|uniref:Acetyltransferase (GNAT) domain-containing protein n=1 Tax=Vibrio xiamenensis TaxID=861298 RepID=A0A1G8DL94_9VIBR|nr:GNAT family N-acetyltransferase [Vibrio xiamenensis]SDH58473.1 Acetyltransferase (GNAT) domain-containing protein [Vibrio xiamenensis]